VRTHQSLIGKAVFGLALGLLLALPIGFGGPTIVKLNSACAEQSASGTTCCVDESSACSGVGEGWYDTGYCGRCGSTFPCPP